MYKQKLEEQIKKMEALQDKCDAEHTTEFLNLATQIMSATRKLDEINDKEYEAEIRILRKNASELKI
jgi:hypothetical protein